MSSCDLNPDLFPGEPVASMVRLITTLISITVVSAWFSSTKIKKLSLFFAHWLAGFVAGLVAILGGEMATVCWTGSSLEGLMRAMKFVQLTALNMYAVTSLAICVNLALIVSAHRTMSRVKSVSSSPVLLGFLLVSMALAAPLLPLAEKMIVTRTGFHLTSENKSHDDFVKLSFFFAEVFVGLGMFTIVAWLLLFQWKEVKECWKIHARIRFYIGLTLVGIAVNFVVAICGAVNLLSSDIRYLLISWSWSFRYIHIALDTIVLYGALRERNMDERGDGNITGSNRQRYLPSGRSVLGDSIARGSGRPKVASSSTSVTPPV